MQKTVTMLFITTLLAGCAGSSGPTASSPGSRYAMHQDRAPSGQFNPERVPDAVPRVETKSPYGNPASYEVFGKRYYVMDSSQGYVARGLASWYGKKFHGHRTSSGEIYDMYTMTAAHTSLPLPTYAEVTHLGNGRSVIVKINDRGPFHAERIIDLSYAAAMKLGFAEHGTARVEVRAIDPRTWAGNNPPSQNRYMAAQLGQPVAARNPESAPTAPLPVNDGPVFIQVGAFSSPDNAERLRQRLSNEFATHTIHAAYHPEQQLYRVRIGPFNSPAEARQLVDDLSRRGLANPHLVND